LKTKCSVEEKRKLSKITEEQSAPLSNPRILKRKLQTQRRNRKAGKHKIVVKSTEFKRAESKRQEENENHPMYDPEVVQKKVNTFAENFTEKTRSNYSKAARKRWKSKKYRELMAVIMSKVHLRRKNCPIRIANYAKAVLISTILLTPRRRSKIHEKAMANSRHKTFQGQELKVKRQIRNRINDYSGVVIDGS